MDFKYSNEVIESFIWKKTQEFTTLNLDIRTSRYFQKEILPFLQELWSGCNTYQMMLPDTLLNHLS